MGLNIKNERVHALAREAARVTGTTQTAAIQAALELLLRELGADPDAQERERRLDVMRQVRLAWDPKPARGDTVREVDDLYDSDTGLPA